MLDAGVKEALTILTVTLAEEMAEHPFVAVTVTVYVVFVVGLTLIELAVPPGGIHH